MSRPISMLLSKTRSHSNKKDKEVHHTLQIRDIATTTTTVVDQDQEVVVDQGALLSAVETVEA